MQHHKNNIADKRIYQRIIPLAVCLFSLYPPLLQSQTTPLPEYKIKAVFLFNFTQFVEWPDDVFNSSTEPFVIGILGKDPFGKYIDEAVAGEKIGSHPLTIVRYRNVKEVGNCRVLFISEADESMSTILSSLNQHAMLTVSDAPAFTQYGGMIGFVTVKNKIRLQININAAKTAGLSISSKLLNVASTSQ